jgi:uncharacterized caspase-like protein
VLKPNTQGTNYALLIATDNYKSPFPHLNNPIFDATDIEQVLRENYGWQTTLLKNPTKDQIMEALEHASGRSYHPEDELLIYISGHGEFDKELHDGVIVASDSIPNDKYKSSYVPYATLHRLIDNGNCKKVLLALDVCFGGTFLDEVAQATRSVGNSDIYNDISLEQLRQRIRTRVARKIMAPGENEPVWDGGPGTHSPLARNFLLALRSRGGTKGFLRFSDIQQLAERTKPSGFAAPFSTDDDPIGDFLFVPLH